MNYGDIIEYKDGTRDLHFEEAMKWAREHNTTFEEDIPARKLPMRFFVIGQEPKKQNEIIKKVFEAHQFLASTDWCVVKIAEAETVAEQAELREKYADTIKKRKEARELINEYENSKEIEDAVKEGEVPESDITEHQGAEESREASEAGSGDSSEQRNEEEVDNG